MRILLSFLRVMYIYPYFQQIVLKAFFTSGHSGQTIRGEIIGTTLGEVTYIAFSYDDQKVAVCVGDEVVILDATVSIYWN